MYSSMSHLGRSWADHSRRGRHWFVCGALSASPRAAGSVVASAVCPWGLVVHMLNADVVNSRRPALAILSRIDFEPVLFSFASRMVTLEPVGIVPNTRSRGWTERILR